MEHAETRGSWERDVPRVARDANGSDVFATTADPSHYYMTWESLKDERMSIRKCMRIMSELTHSGSWQGTQIPQICETRTESSRRVNAFAFEY